MASRYHERWLDIQNSDSIDEDEVPDDYRSQREWGLVAAAKEMGLRVDHVYLEQPSCNMYQLYHALIHLPAATISHRRRAEEYDDMILVVRLYRTGPQTMINKSTILTQEGIIDGHLPPFAWHPQIMDGGDYCTGTFGNSISEAWEENDPQGVLLAYIAASRSYNPGDYLRPIGKSVSKCWRCGEKTVSSEHLVLCDLALDGSQHREWFHERHTYTCELCGLEVCDKHSKSFATVRSSRKRHLICQRCINAFFCTYCNFGVLSGEGVELDVEHNNGRCIAHASCLGEDRVCDECGAAFLHNIISCPVDIYCDIEMETDYLCRNCSISIVLEHVGEEHESHFDALQERYRLPANPPWHDEWRSWGPPPEGARAKLDAMIEEDAAAAEKRQLMELVYGQSRDALSGLMRRAGDVSSELRRRLHQDDMPLDIEIFIEDGDGNRIRLDNLEFSLYYEEGDAEREPEEQ